MEWIQPMELTYGDSSRGVRARVPLSAQVPKKRMRSICNKNAGGESYLRPFPRLQISTNKFRLRI